MARCFNASVAVGFDLDVRGASALCEFIAALLGAINAVSVQSDYDAVEHTHVEHGTQ
jgi:hypothetical protein